MGEICTRLLPECVLLDPDVSDKEALVRSLVDLLAEAHGLDDAQTLVEDILEREELGSTCLGFGCAIPHAHSDVLESTLLAAARLTPPLDFEAPDEEPVSLVFLLAGPRGNAGLHIKLLSKLARWLHNPEFRDALRGAKSREAFYRLLCREDE